MSEARIYKALRGGGLSRAGALAVMGNMYCESALRADNVQNNCPMSDADYTLNVDYGTYSEEQFVNDQYGYGLCQWTFPTRKRELLSFAHGVGCSIGNEEMQCAFAILELMRDFGSLFSYLQTATDLAEAVEKVCREYERPAVNNIPDRYAAAVIYANMPLDSEEEIGDGCTPDSCPIDFTDNHATCDLTVRALSRGDLGRDVFMLQCGLSDMGIDCGIPDGDFGRNTEKAVNELKQKYDLVPDGIADQFVWQIIFH